MKLRLLLVLAWVLLAVPAGAVPADGRAEIAQVRVDQNDEAILLSVNASLNLNQRQAEAIERGVPLFFTMEYEVLRPRWYWFDERVSQGERTYRVAYSALTQQYRVSDGGLHISYASLPEALQAIGRVLDWSIVNKSALNAGSHYNGQVRLRLDVSLLPKPFQVHAINSRDWTLSSDWQHFRFVPHAPVTEIQK